MRLVIVLKGFYTTLKEKTLTETQTGIPGNEMNVQYLVAVALPFTMFITLIYVSFNARHESLSFFSSIMDKILPLP